MAPKRRSGGARRHKREEEDLEYMTGLCEDLSTRQPTTACEDDEPAAFDDAYHSCSANEAELKMQRKQATEESLFQGGEGEQQQNTQQEITNAGALAEREKEEEQDGGHQKAMKEKEYAGEAEGAEADESKDRKEAEEEEETKDGEEPLEGEGQEQEGSVELQRRQQQEEQQQQQQAEQQREGGEMQLQEEEEQRQQPEEELRHQREEDVQQTKHEPIETLHSGAAGIAAGAAPLNGDGGDEDGTVAEETESAGRPEDPAPPARWSPLDGAEFSVAPSPNTGAPGACYVTGLATSVCEQLFVSENGPYGPSGRTRVFNEAAHVVGDRIPAATARYLHQAETESLADACLSCAEDASGSCFPATRLLMETILASGAAVCSLAYNYRKEILKGMHCVYDTAFDCFRTCICTLMPPPQEPRRVDRPPPAPWTSLGTLTGFPGLSGGADTANMNPQQRREWRLASMQTASLPCYVSREGGEQQAPQTTGPYLHPLAALTSGRAVFSKRSPGNC